MARVRAITIGENCLYKKPIVITAKPRRTKKKEEKYKVIPANEFWAAVRALSASENMSQSEAYALLSIYLQPARDNT